jgi:hypothetical protein
VSTRAGGPTSETLAEDEQRRPPRWAPWDRLHDSDAAVARYVSSEAVTGRGLTVRRDPDDDDLAVAKRVYARLHEQGLGYQHERRLVDSRMQAIRDPQLLLRDKVGSCIDLATTFAGMCLAAHVSVLLAITDDHAFVLLVPDRPRDDEGLPSAPFAPAGLTPADDEPGGVFDVPPGALAPALADGTLVAVEVGAVVSRFGDFGVAVEEGRRLADSPFRIIDVEWLHCDDAYRPFAPPADRPSIHLHVPPSGTFEDYPGREETIEEIRAATGTVVLLAPSGRGKSWIARRLAEEAPFGAGWFLDASQRQTLFNSLAEADRAERDADAGGMARQDRQGFAYSGLARLADMEDPWVVVLDNADGDPGRLRDLMPRPRGGQRLLVTSTNERWRDAPDVQVIELPAISDDDVARRVGADLVPLVDGRPLLLAAFGRLMRETGVDASGIAALAPKAAPEERDPGAGPAALWAALRSADGFDERELLVSACAAYLPPDHQPLTTLEALVPDAREAARFLVDRGLLTFEVEGTRSDDDRAAVRMHRLFGAAVRAHLEADRPELADQVVGRLVREDAPYTLLDKHGDLDTVQRLAARIVAGDRPGDVSDPALGLALHGVAKLLELHGQTQPSGDVFGRAKRHLEGHPIELADCLQGEARTVNQHRTDDEGALHEAVGWAQQARTLILDAGGKPASADRCRAMEGLLMLKLARFSHDGKTKLDLLRAALAVIDEADRRRIANPDLVDEVELARSRFNLAGPRISLAQAEPHRAAEHLDRASEIYQEVLERRERLYDGRRIHPHIAACIHGLGLTEYYRALLVADSQEARSRHLRAATEHTAEALKQRQTLDGSIDLGEAGKSAALLAKIALARQSSPTAHVSVPLGTWRDARRELTNAHVVLETVPPVPSERTQIAAAIAAWVRSPALAVLVEEFGGSVGDGDLAETLDELERFSAERWDFRRGRERNLVVAPQFTTATERVVLAAARALGLEQGTAIGPLPKGRADHVVVAYDDVLILGGLVRACLARPLYAAREIAAGRIEAACVTALGGFREIAGDEVGLVERITGDEVSDELHAMDAGVRNAFGVTEPVRDEGESAEQVGASWRVREYVTAAGLPVRVVAAPSSEPGVRRANTPDAYAWFAMHLARLRPGQRILVVTTDIYVPYQHADAVRMLALPFGVTVETAGMQPGRVDQRLRQTFAPHNYLQEIRSAIRALRDLHAAL